jgi:hypothetical protein
MRMSFHLLMALALAGCATIKPYEKEYLLNPVMDDGAVSSLTPGMLSLSCAEFEKLGTSGPGAGAATSCPTCGG